MENRAHALAAGLFVILLGVAALLTLFWFGGKKEQTREVILVTDQNVTGLNPQSQVRYRGIPVGKVADIRIDPQDRLTTLISIQVRDDLPLTEGTTARLGYQGITGLAHVLLEDKGQDGDRLAGEKGKPPRIQMQPSLFQELSDSGAGLLKDAKELMAGLKTVLDQENRDKMDRIFSHIEGSTRQLQPAMEKLNVTLSSLNRLLSEDNVSKLSKAAGEAGPLMHEAKGLVAKLHGVSDKVDRALGEPGNSAALVPRINELTGELTATTRQLNRVLKLLEDSPQSLIFGPPPPQPGPGEPGFVVPVGQGSTP